MKDKNLQIQILFELLTANLNETNLIQLLKKTLTTLLKKLNCSAGCIYFEDRSKNTVKPLSKIYSIPHNIGEILSFKTAEETLLTVRLKQNKSDNNTIFPIADSISDDEHYYIYGLENLGYIILIKNGGKLSNYYVKTLPIIFKSLSTTCKLIIQNQELLDTQQDLKKHNLELQHSHKVNETILKQMKATQNELIASEQKYRDLYDNATIGLYKTTVDGDILVANHALIKMLGYTSLKELRKINVSERGYVDSEQRNIFRQSIHREGQVSNFESEWRKKDGTTLFIRENAKVIKNDNGKVVSYEGYVEDITEQEKIRKKLLKKDSQLRHLERFENLIMTLATEFITVSVDEMDTALNKLLEKVGVFTEVDRSYLFNINHEKKVMSNTHEWVANGISAEKDNLQNLPTSIFPWWMKKLSRNEIIHIENLESMPTDAHNEKDILQEQNIKALVVLPLFINKKLYGFIGFDSVQKSKKWEKASIKILEMVAMLISNMISRSQTIISLDAEREKYRTLFLDSPIAHLEEDFSKFKNSIDQLKEDRVTDFKKYLKDNNHVRELASTIEIKWANKAALDLYEVSSLKEMSTHLQKLVPVSSYPQLAYELLQIINGKRKVSTRMQNLTSNGKIKDIEINWVVSARYQESLSSTIVSLIDITKRLSYEQQIKNSLIEKERLLSEIHHRVKNNMQMVSAMLELQTDYLNENNAKESFIIASNRIQSMTMIHEKLYETKNFGVIDLKSYLSDLVTSLIESYQENEHLVVELQIEKYSIEIDSAITCGLLLNEIITNSMKHAFKGKKNNRKLKVKMNKLEHNKIRLIVHDNGIGLPDNFDIHSTRSLGMQLIIGFINELNGTFKIETDCGTKYDIELQPKKKSRKHKI